MAEPADLSEPRLVKYVEAPIIIASKLSQNGDSRVQETE